MRVPLPRPTAAHRLGFPIADSADEFGSWIVSEGADAVTAVLDSGDVPELESLLRILSFNFAVIPANVPACLPTLLFRVMDSGHAQAETLDLIHRLIERPHCVDEFMELGLLTMCAKFVSDPECFRPSLCIFRTLAANPRYARAVADSVDLRWLMEKLALGCLVPDEVCIHGLFAELVEHALDGLDEGLVFECLRFLVGEALESKPSWPSKNATLYSLYHCAKSEALSRQLMADDRFNYLLRTCFELAQFQLLALKTTARILYSCNSQWALDIDSIVWLARTGGTVEIRAAALLVLENFMVCEQAVECVVESGGFTAIKAGIRGPYEIRATAAIALANLLASARPEIIRELLNDKLLEMIVIGLRIDEDSCAVAVLDGLLTVLEIESRNGRFAECWKRFAAAGGIQCLEELDRAPEVGEKLALLWKMQLCENKSK
jgi:hypothetical protein